MAVPSEQDRHDQQGREVPDIGRVSEKFRSFIQRLVRDFSVEDRREVQFLIASGTEIKKADLKFALKNLRQASVLMIEDKDPDLTKRGLFLLDVARRFSIQAHGRSHKKTREILEILAPAARSSNAILSSGYYTELAHEYGDTLRGTKKGVEFEMKCAAAHLDCGRATKVEKIDAGAGGEIVERRLSSAREADINSRAFSRSSRSCRRALEDLRIVVSKKESDLTPEDRQLLANDSKHFDKIKRLLALTSKALSQTRSNASQLPERFSHFDPYYNALIDVTEAYKEMARYLKAKDIPKNQPESVTSLNFDETVDLAKELSVNSATSDAALPFFELALEQYRILKSRWSTGLSPDRGLFVLEAITVLSTSLGKSRQALAASKEWTELHEELNPGTEKAGERFNVYLQIFNLALKCSSRSEAENALGKAQEIAQNGRRVMSDPEKLELMVAEANKLAAETFEVDHFEKAWAKLAEAVDFAERSYGITTKRLFPLYLMQALYLARHLERPGAKDSSEIEADFKRVIEIAKKGFDCFDDGEKFESETERVKAHAKKYAIAGIVKASMARRRINTYGRSLFDPDTRAEHESELGDIHEDLSSAMEAFTLAEDYQSQVNISNDDNSRRLFARIKIWHLEAMANTELLAKMLGAHNTVDEQAYLISEELTEESRPSDETAEEAALHIKGSQVLRDAAGLPQYGPQEEPKITYRPKDALDLADEILKIPTLTDPEQLRVLSLKEKLLIEFNIDVAKTRAKIEELQIRMVFNDCCDNTLSVLDL